MNLAIPGGLAEDGSSLNVDQDASTCRKSAGETSHANDSEECPQSRSNHVAEEVKTSSDDQGQMIKVQVGSTCKEFLLYKDEAMRHSHYLRHILSDMNEQQTIVLPDVQVELFQLFADFLVHGETRTERTRGEDTLAGRRWRYHYDDEWVLLADAWLLGDVLASTTFKDAVVDEIALKVKQDRKVPMDMYRLLWRSEIPRTCGIKRLLMDLAVACWDEEDRGMRYSGGAIEDEGVQEFFRALIELQADVELWRKCVSSIDMLLFEVGCRYHDHYEEWEECYRGCWPAM